MQHSDKGTARNYARPVGVYGVMEFSDLTKEDDDLSTWGDQLTAEGGN